MADAVGTTRRGRGARKTIRQTRDVTMLPALKRRLPLTEPMDQDQIEKIDAASMRVLEDVGVVFRDPIAIARSFFALDYFGPSGGPWKDWMLPPTTPFAPYRLRADEVQSQFDLIFGYLVGIAARTRELRSLTPQANWIDVDLSDLATPDGAQRLFEQLRVKPPEDLTSVLDERVNIKATRKNKVNQDLPTEVVAAHWRSFFERFIEDPEVQHFARRNGLDNA